jgi:hypothetical protein
MTSPSATPSPRPGDEGVPEPAGWRRCARLALVPLLVLGAVATLAALGLAFLYAMNPIGDEWICSEGEAPAGNECYPTDGRLPAGVEWEPLGNRPMPYNCDKDGWILIQHDRRDDQDCLSVHLPMPDGWHAAD